jgi:hypothetical protein
VDGIRLGLVVFYDGILGVFGCGRERMVGSKKKQRKKSDTIGGRKATTIESYIAYFLASLAASVPC